MRMLWYRITKYNPAYRDASGAYIKDEWISFSDVGKYYNDEIFSIQEYERVEQAYIQAIVKLMHFFGIDQLKCIYCWKPEKKLIDTTVPQEWVSVYDRIRRGSIISGNEIEVLLRLILRDYLVCKLAYRDQFFVHFGYDYYMYVGVPYDCASALQEIQKTGLFVEEIPVSPYLESED